MSEPKTVTAAERAALRHKKCPTCGKPARIDNNLPSRWDMVKNLVQAAKDAIASGLDVRSESDTEKAMKICSECPNLTGDQESPRCGVCGCHLKYKVQLTAWHCPIGKW